MRRTMAAWKGMKCKVHPLFAVLLFASAWTPYFAEMLLLFGTVIVHELGHVTAAFMYGYRVKELEILPFGGVAVLEHGSMGWRPRHEAMIAIAGPLMNFVMLFAVIGAQQAGVLTENVAPFLVEVNLTLAFFNLLPALPLDGGRILRAAFSRSLGFRKATGVAIGMAFILSSVLMILGLLALWAGFVQIGMVALGVFLFVSAWQLRRQIHYDTIRFLDTKRRQRQNRLLPVRSLVATPDTPLLKVLAQFAPDSYHLVYVRDGQRRRWRVLSEEELLDAAMQPGGVRMEIGQIFAEH